ETCPEIGQPVERHARGPSLDERLGEFGIYFPGLSLFFDHGKVAVGSAYQGPDALQFVQRSLKRVSLVCQLLRGHVRSDCVARVFYPCKNCRENASPGLHRRGQLVLDRHLSPPTVNPLRRLKPSPAPPPGRDAGPCDISDIMAQRSLDRHEPEGDAGRIPGQAPTNPGSGSAFFLVVLLPAPDEASIVGPSEGFGDGGKD